MASITTGLTQHMSTFYDKVFLERAKLVLRYDIGADIKKLARNMGKTVFWNRMTPLAVATTPLTEATNPSSTDMTSTIVSAAVAEYGAFTNVGSLYSMTSIDEGLKEHVSVHGQNAGETIDTLIRAELAGGGTEQIVNSVDLTAVAATDTLDGVEVRKVVRNLFLAKAMKFEDGLYRSIIPTSVVHDLRGDSEWLDAYRYTDASNIRNGDVGTLHGVRFIETNNEELVADAGAGTVDVYTTFFFGKHAYGVVDLAGQVGPRIIVKNPGSGDTSNPLDMFSTIGWKAFFAVKVLNSAWLYEVKSASSVGSN